MELAPLVPVLMTVLGLTALITLSVLNAMQFFNELLVSAFIVLALMFFKASATVRK